MPDFSRRISGLPPKKRTLLQEQLRLVRARAVDTQRIQPVEGEGPWPLSFAQERLWFIDQLYGADPTYNELNLFRLAGDLDVDAVQQALNEIVERHEVLRTVYINEGGEPRQLILPARRVPLPVNDLRSVPDEGLETFRQLALAAAHEPFDLAQDFMLRAHLYRMGDDDYRLLLVKHHIATDGWSTQILLRELSELYAAAHNGRPASLPSLPIQYKDFAVWQRSEAHHARLSSELSYWKEQLHGLPVLELPTDRPRPAKQDHNSRTIFFHIPQAISKALGDLALEAHATRYMVLMSAFLTLLYRRSGQVDISAGTPVANRQKVDLEGLLGFFVNMLVIRGDLSGNPSFRDLLARLRAVILEALQHQDLAYAQLIAELQPERHVNRNPLFQVAFQVSGETGSRLDFPGIVVQRERFDFGIGKFDINVAVSAGDDSWLGHWQYSTALFDEETAQQMVAHFLQIMEAIALDSDVRVDRLPPLRAGAGQSAPAGRRETAVSPPKKIHEPLVVSADAALVSAVEAGVAAIWAAVLGIDRVGSDEHFLDLGGGSMQAMQILARVRSAFQVQLSYSSLFTTPTVADMARAIVAADAAELDVQTSVPSAVRPDEGGGPEQQLASGRSVSKPNTFTREERRLLFELNETAVPYPREQTIHALFEQQVHRSPQETAVTFEGKALSYAELDQRANQLAHYLIEQGIQPGDIVGLALERSLDLIAALLAILKAGGAYLPVDSAYPAERIRGMFEDAQCRRIITYAAAGSTLPAAADRLILVDDRQTGQAIAGGSSDRPHLDVDLTAVSPAYVIFTSGSTGRPKGVVIPHRGVVRLVKNNNFADLGPEQRFMQFAPISFDAATLEIWGPLLNGGQLFVYPPGPANLSDLAAYLRAHRISYLFLTSGLFHQMVEHEVETLAGVQQVQSGGDVVSAAHVRRLLRQGGICRFTNVYGPTENTTYTTFNPVRDAETLADRIPIGKPIHNSTVYILDEDMQPAPVGVPGELYIGGDGLALGYLNNPQLTAEKFIVDHFSSDSAARLYRTGDRACYLPDGTIDFLGRRDRQMKIRGFRIEPVEIENRLTSHEDVQEAVVVSRDSETAGKQLLAYIVPAAGRTPDAGALSGYVAQLLPDYMIPQAIIPLERMPLDPNGKIDRGALPEPEIGQQAAGGQETAPGTPQEIALAAIWQEVLDLPSVDIHTNFFDAGGHSLLGIRLLAIVEERLGKRLPVSLLFEAATVAELAPYLADDEPVSRDQTLVPIRSSGTRPPFFCVHGFGGGVLGYADLSEKLGNDQPFYGLQAAGLNGEVAPDETIEAMAQRYVRAVREVQPDGPYYIGGYCVGGVIAFEMARQLEDLGEETAVLALIEGSAPGARKNGGPTLDRSYLATIWRSIPFWAQDYVTFGVSHLRRQVRAKARQQAVQWQRRFGQTAELDLTDRVALDLEGVPDHQRQLMTTHLRALGRYNPGAYNGRVSLFRAEHKTISSALFRSGDETNGWAALARGGVDIHVVAGAHRNVHLAPYVASLAESLSTSLKQSPLPTETGS